jgi:hypothetical protein
VQHLYCSCLEGQLPDSSYADKQQLLTYRSLHHYTVEVALSKETLKHLA